MNRLLDRLGPILDVVNGKTVVWDTEAPTMRIRSVAELVDCFQDQIRTIRRQNGGPNSTLGIISLLVRQQLESRVRRNAPRRELTVQGSSVSPVRAFPSRGGTALHMLSLST